MTPGDEFIRIYAALEQADREKSDAHLMESKALYEAALKDLLSLQTTFPEWKPKVIAYRVRYVQQMLKQVEEEIKVAQTAAFGSAQDQGVVVDSETQAQQQETAALRSNVERLLREKSLLEAQLREAFAARPAAVEPDKLIQAQSTIDDLKAELELSQMQLAELKQSMDKAGEADLDLVEEAPGETESPTATVREDQLVQLQAKLEVLEGIEAEWKERQAYLEQRIQTATVEWQAAQKANKRLQEDNQVLQIQLQENTNSATSDAEVLLKAQLKSSESRIADLQSQIDQLNSNNQTLQQQLAEERDKVVAGAGPSNLATTSSGDTGVEVEKELNRLKARLSIFEAQKVPYSDEQLKLFKIPQPEDPIFRLESRESGDGSPRVGMRKVEVKLETFQTIQTARRALANGNESIAQSGMQGIALREKNWIAVAESLTEICKSSDFKEMRNRAEILLKGLEDQKLARFARIFLEASIKMAERDFEEVIALQQELIEIQEQADILNDIALAYLELGRMELAESAARRGLKLEPGYANSLYVLGLIRFRQERFEEAIDYMSQAVKARPDFVQAYVDLGVALFEAGYPVTGENSIRKGLLVAPNYPPAHAYLAQMYIDQNPPVIALANFHYQKYLQFGGARIPALEGQMSAAEKK
jgi:tetratricopeptide (TPR) repeat protein